ncbi:MAG: hypothetical protein FWB80_08500 [Defluviitaleaceae bacterium]|nr:hypothetical protein [Defluviitaleaceae bacterium]
MNENEQNLPTEETEATRDDGILHVTREYGINFKKGIYPLATLIYLVMGIYWGMWHPGWLIFVGAWLLTVIVHYFQTGKFKMSIYGVAWIVFLWLAFGMGYWMYAWLVFIAAWVIESMIVPTKPKKKKKKKKDREREEGEN